MVKAVMCGYDESDMDGLFQSVRRKTRSTIIFISSIALVLVIIGIIYAVAVAFDDMGIFSAGIKTFRWIFVAIIGLGVLQFCGNPKAKLNSYPDSYKEGCVLACFDNTAFYYTALQKQIVSTQELINSAISNLENKAKPHSYSELSKALEDRERFYLFFNAKEEYPLIIRKESICQGTAEQLKEILSVHLKENFKTLKFKPIQEDVW